MRKSGLHKQISSIFDGVPVPSNGIVSENTEPLEELTELPSQDAPAQVPSPVDDSQGNTQTSNSGPSLVQRMNADPSDALQSDTVESEPTPVVQVGRPMPLPKSKALTKTVKGPSFSTQVKKAIFGSQSTIDPRQKKAAVLVGVLSLVFGVVMFVSLGGVSGNKPAKAEAADSGQIAHSQNLKRTVENWEKPAALPENLRNATTPVVVHSDALQTSEATGSDSLLVVKGIVFSKNKPSAIINDQILTEGQTFNGVTITKITKDSVEFQADEKRWTQRVQR